MPGEKTARRADPRPPPASRPRLFARPSLSASRPPATHSPKKAPKRVVFESLSPPEARTGAVWACFAWFRCVFETCLRRDSGPWKHPGGVREGVKRVGETQPPPAATRPAWRPHPEPVEGWRQGSDAGFYIRRQWRHADLSG